MQATRELHRLHVHHRERPHEKPSIAISDVADVARDVREVMRFADLKTTGSDLATLPRIWAGIFASAFTGGVGATLGATAVMTGGLAGVVLLPTLGIVLNATDLVNLKEALSGVAHFGEAYRSASPEKRALIEAVLTKAVESHPNAEGRSAGAELLQEIQSKYANNGAVAKDGNTLAAKVADAYLAHLDGDTKGFDQQLATLKADFGLSDELCASIRSATPRKLTYGLTDVAKQLFTRDHFD